MSNTLSFADRTELVFETPPWASWNLDVHRNDSGRDAAHAVDPETHRNIAIHERDCLYQRREVSSRPGERLAEYRRLKLREIDVDGNGNVWLEFDAGERYSAKGVLTTLESSDRTWQRQTPDGIDGSGSTWRQWEGVRDRSAVPTPPSCAALTVSQVSGTGSRAQVNDFLEGGPDGLVDHTLGGVHVWKAAFEATYHGETIAVLILSTPASPHVDPSSEIVISRLACHPVRPQNTSSWFIARVREWARDHGYDRLVAYAGVGGNDGTCYEAAGFELEELVWADGSGWTNRDGRGEVANGDRWRRSKWVSVLE
jgi:hypothetical protein